MASEIDPMKAKQKQWIRERILHRIKLGEDDLTIARLIGLDKRSITKIRKEVEAKT